jgi:SAM-dependent methyltransferase
MSLFHDTRKGSPLTGEPSDPPQLPPLFAGTAEYYSRFRPRYPAEFFENIGMRIGLDGSGRMLDVGCGTGFMAVGFSRRFESVVALDRDSRMLDVGLVEATAAGVTNITWVEDTAEALALYRSSYEWHEELFNLIPRNRIGKRRPPWDKDR